MENCVSKDTIEIIKKGIPDHFVSKRKAFWCGLWRGEDKLKRTRDDIDELCKKYPWLRELGRGYLVQP